MVNSIAYTPTQAQENELYKGKSYIDSCSKQSQVKLVKEDMLVSGYTPRHWLLWG